MANARSKNKSAVFFGLRLRLTLLYALLAGAVLLAFALMSLSDYERESRTAFDAAFDSAARGVAYKLQSDRSVSQQWLAQTEAADRQILSIEDSGVKLAFQGAWTADTPRDVLIDRADKMAGDAGLKKTAGELTPQSVTFEVEGDSSDRYLSRVTLIPAGDSGSVKIVMLRDLGPEFERMRQRRAATLGWAAAGLLALCIAGYIYSRRAVRPAEESFRRQAEFTAMASHELKTPLSVLTASVDALKTYPQTDRALSLLDGISSESMRMARLVEDLLVLARSDAGGWRTDSRPVDMDTVLITLTERFSPAFKAKGVKLGIELPDEPLKRVEGDEGQIYQIMSILVDNALCYTQSGGTVTVFAENRKGSVIASVSDDGPGIPDEDKPRVFDRFYRCDKSHSDPKHSGLGLAVAKELARANSGEISVFDAKPRGTRFTLELSELSD